MSFPSKAVETRLIEAFCRAAREVPAYRELLDEGGVQINEIVDFESFARACPILARGNTFDRFALDRLCAGGALGDLAGVLTSSGHGGNGRFSFGLIDRVQAENSGAFIDEALDLAFQVKTKKTLAINCLPMGVVFSSNVMTIATTSVREDMAVGIIEAFGRYFDQIILVGDPLFLKRLTDYAGEKQLDWSRYQVNAIVGEEIFGERYRSYLGNRLALHGTGYIMASLGVAELGLHLGFETPATIALRRAASTNHEFARDLLGIDSAAMGVPMLYSFDPRRIFVEAVNPDANGYGLMAVSTLDTGLRIPLMRYQTGDVVRPLNTAAILDATRGHGISLPAELPEVIFALGGRDKERLPNGSHVGLYKDALFTHHELARHFTGAFRLTFDGEDCTMHVQLVAGVEPAASWEDDLLRAFAPNVRPGRLSLWAYERFPFGLCLDYERKFTYYVPGDSGRA